MKLKLTALLLVLYTGLYAQNKIVLTAPRLDTSSLSNRINLKANTNLNNVNGVLSSTYGGAGSVSGILKANGSGVVSAAVAGTDYVAGSSLSGTTNYIPKFTSSTAIGNSVMQENSNSIGIGVTPNTWSSDYRALQVSNYSSFYGRVSSNESGIFNNAYRDAAAQYTYINTAAAGWYAISGGVHSWFTAPSGTAGASVTFTERLNLSSTTLTSYVPISGTSLSMSGEGLFGGAVTNGTDKLIVAGSGLFTGAITASSNLTVNGIYNVPSTSYFKGNATYGFRFNNEADTENLLVIANSGAITASSSVTASSLIKSGGTSAQFLKADGSVDGSTYLTSAGAVTSISGTTNQITVSASTGAVTVSLPSAVTISGAMNASSFFETSDLRKKDIVSVTEQADGIDFVGFKWKKELNLDSKKHLGVIAQQVEKVIPDAVTTDEKGFKSVNYTEVLIFKLQFLTEKVSELEKELKKLKTKKLKN